VAVILSLHLARRSRGEMYSGHGRLCVCLRAYTSPHSHTTTRTRINLGHHTGCPPVVHHWADLQSMHGFRCYGNIHVCNLSILTSQICIDAKAKHLRLLVVAQWLVMTALCNRAGHYIFALWFLSLFLSSFYGRPMKLGGIIFLPCGYYLSIFFS